MSQIEQSELNAFIRLRDEASFRALYQAHTPMIFGLAVRISGSQSEAEELTQEAWVRAIERLEKFDRRSRFSTWLSGILINCHRESFRRKARTRPLPPEADHLLAEVIDAFPVPVSNKADPEDIEKALSELADGYREVVVLHDLEGYTHKEIASMLGIQSGTSKSQLMRGRAQLRRILTRENPQYRNKDKGGQS